VQLIRGVVERGDRLAPGGRDVGLEGGELGPDGVELGLAGEDVRADQAIRRGTFRSVKDLTSAIGRFIDAYSRRCQPFSWTKDADGLIAKVKPSKN
jgi:hypothetical protein